MPNIESNVHIVVAISYSSRSCWGNDTNFASLAGETAHALELVQVISITKLRCAIRETVPDSPINLFPESLAAGWSCLSAAAGEAAERVRLVGGGILVGAGRCCSHNEGSESDSSADHYFRDHLVVLSLHVILFPQR